MSRKVEVARKIHAHLDSIGASSVFRAVKTSTILDDVEGIARTERQWVLKLLHGLAARGFLGRKGDGSFRWYVGNVPFPKAGNPYAGHPVLYPEIEKDHLGQTGIKKDKKPSFVAIDDPVTGGVKTDDTDAVGALKSEIAILKNRIASLEEGGNTFKRVEVVSKTKVVELKNVTLPAVYQTVLDLAACRRHIMLVGPAGCGKSHLAQLIADSLGLGFGSVSCTAGMSEAHLLGRAVPNLTDGTTSFQTTEFITCFEEGGVFLLDELDAADSNVLLMLNSALANGYLNVPGRPDKPRAKKHKDFVLIATANTYGRGANRVYSGRTQLDEATLDRFRIGTIECTYDAHVEAALCPDQVLRERLSSIRSRIESAGLRRVMSTRFMMDAYQMQEAAKWEMSKILDIYFSGWTREERAKVE